SPYFFLLGAHPRGCSLDAVVGHPLQLKPGPRADERACFTHELTELLRPEILRRESMQPLYRDVELPLAGVLARMEYTGIRVNSEALGSLSAMLETQIAALTTEIHRSAGREF